LPPDFALQHPGDYLESMRRAIRGVLRRAPAETIIGIGVDFTACTILPVRRDGMPLMMCRGLEKNPHAWVKLWKHHAAQRVDLIRLRLGG
jgi:L-ribulokinase